MKVLRGRPKKVEKEMVRLLDREELMAALKYGFPLWVEELISPGGFSSLRALQKWKRSVACKREQFLDECSDAIADADASFFETVAKRIKLSGEELEIWADREAQTFLLAYSECLRRENAEAITVEKIRLAISTLVIAGETRVLHGNAISDRTIRRTGVRLGFWTPRPSRRLS